MEREELIRRRITLNTIITAILLVILYIYSVFLIMKYFDIFSAQSILEDTRGAVFGTIYCGLFLLFASKVISYIGPLVELKYGKWSNSREKLYYKNKIKEDIYHNFFIIVFFIIAIITALMVLRTTVFIT